MRNSKIASKNSLNSHTLGSSRQYWRPLSEDCDYGMAQSFSLMYLMKPARSNPVPAFAYAAAFVLFATHWVSNGGPAEAAPPISPTEMPTPISTAASFLFMRPPRGRIGAPVERTCPVHPRVDRHTRAGTVTRSRGGRSSTHGS